MGRVALPRWSAAAAVAFALLLLTWSGYYAAQQLSHRWNGKSEDTAGQDRIPLTGSQSNLQYDVAHIIRAHLFGRQDEPVKANPEPVPETRLQINLLGLIASADEAKARAIIRVQGNRVKPYGIGQRIDGTDAILAAVERDQAFLRRGDALETLSLKRASLGDVASAGNPSAADQGRTYDSALPDNGPDVRLDPSAVEQMTQPF